MGAPLSWPVSAVPGNHMMLSDAQVVVRVQRINDPATRRVYDLVCLPMIYDNALRMQVGELKKENKRRREREARTCRCTENTYISRHSERWY